MLSLPGTAASSPAELGVVDMTIDSTRPTVQQSTTESDNRWARSATRAATPDGELLLHVEIDLVYHNTW
jgi:hypothetical protein